MNLRLTVVYLSSVIVICAGLSACNNRLVTQSAPLVKVNGEEITAIDLQQAVANADGNRAASDDVLEALVDQKLLQGEAARMQLERDPQVAAAVESAKSRVLAQAYLDRKAAQAGKPTQREIDDYYTQHPEFFAERKLVDFKILAVDGTGKNEDFKRAVDAAKSLDDVAAWLDGRNLPYARNHVVRSTADLPPALAQRMRGVAAGQPLIVTAEGERAMVAEIVGIAPSPLSRDEAQASIVRALLEQKSQEIAKAEVTRLRSAAKLVYLNRPVSRVAGAHAGNLDTGRVISE